MARDIEKKFFRLNFQSARVNPKTSAMPVIVKALNIEAVMVYRSGSRTTDLRLCQIIQRKIELK